MKLGAWRGALVLALLALTTAFVSAQARNIPANAESNGFGGWRCKTGFVKSGTKCATVAEASDSDIRAHLVERSMTGYSGNCPCPFNTDRAGRRCGGRSAYSRSGGASVLCFPTDVSDTAVKAFRGGRNQWR